MKHIACTLTYDKVDGKYKGYANIESSDGVNLDIATDEHEKFEDFAEDLYNQMYEGLKKSKSKSKRDELKGMLEEELNKYYAVERDYSNLGKEMNTIRSDIEALVKEIKKLD